MQRIEQAVRHAEELYCDMHALELAEHPEQVNAIWEAFSHSLQKRQSLREYKDFAKYPPEVFDAYSADDRKAYADALGLVSPDNQERDFTHAVITQEIVWRDEQAGSASISHPSAQEREDFSPIMPMDCRLSWLSAVKIGQIVLKKHRRQSPAILLRVLITTTIPSARVSRFHFSLAITWWKA